MHDQSREVLELFSALMEKETILKNPIKGLTLFRIDRSFPRVPYAYNSEIIILGQGEKRVTLGDDVYIYDPSHYLVLPVPLPAECEGRAEPGKPILGLTISIDPMEIGDLLSSMGESQREFSSLPKGLYSAPLDGTLCEATARLLKSIADPLDRRVLAPMIRREMIYRVLRGDKGEVLQALVHGNRRFFQIAKVLQTIHEAYSGDWNIDRIANEVGMSNSTFHASFKAVTNTSPLQYIKNVRLHKARILMIQDGYTANTAAFQVGYESPSQFSREYKRLFGVTPSQDSILSR